MPEKSPSPSLFHKLLCLQPQELSPEEFYATLYQFTQLCWVEEYPERPWNGVPIPLEYDPTSPSLHHQVDLYKLYLHVMAIGGSQRTTATDSWRQIGYISGLNVYDNRPEALATVCQAVYFRYLRCYEVYSDIVRTMYWEHLIKPSNYKYSGTRRGFLHNDAQWRNRLNQLPDIGIRSRLLVDLPTHPTRRYANELLELRESIKRDTERESGRLVFRGVDLHLVPDPDPLPVVHLHPLFKNLVRPMDSVSNTDDDDDTLGVNPYSPYDGKIRSYSPPLDPRVEQERQRLMARNRRGLRDERKRTPPPRTVFQVDDLTWDSDNDFDSNAAGKQKEQEEEGYPALASRLEDYVKRAISVDHDELEAKYGITKFEEHPESKGSFLEYDFGDYLYYAGMEGLMPIWREWIKSDPGFHAASREVDTDGGYYYDQVNSLSTQHEWADELQDISKFEGRSVAWNIRNKTFRPDPLELEGFKLEDTWEDQNRDTRSPEGTQSYQKGSETPETSRETSPEGVIKIRDSIFIRFELGASSKVNTTKQAWQRQSFINQSTWADMIDYENDMNDMADDTEDDTGDYDREQGPWSPFMISRDEWDQKALKEWQIFMRSKTQDGTAENPFVIDDDCMNERENSQDVSPGNVVVIKREADSMNGRDVSPGTVGGPSKRKREADSVDEQNVSRDVSPGTGVGKSKRKRAVWPKRKREADNMDERDVSPGTAGSLSKRKRAVGPKP